MPNKFENGRTIRQRFRRRFWLWSVCAMMFCALELVIQTQAIFAAERPNVVFILADDLGYSDLGCYGGEIATPHLDALAANGLRYTQFYNTARCWPSRSALLTGYYAQQINRDPQGQRPRWAALAPQLLKSAGYRSYHSGKWHVDGPILAGGFDRSYDIADHDRFFAPKRLTLNDKVIAGPSEGDNYYVTSAVAKQGIEWLNEHHRDHAGQPFFLYLAFTSPHFPLHALPEDIARYADKYREGWEVAREKRWKRQREMKIHGVELSAFERDTVPSWNLSEKDLQAKIGPGEVGHAVPWAELTSEQREFQATKMAIHAAMVDRMDREIGQVLSSIRSMGEFDNTLIFFASDNGASAEQIIRGDLHDKTAPLGSGKSYLGLGPGWSTAANAPFRKHKHWTHEGGISTPLIAHWPKGIKARGELRHTPGHLVDIVPTMLELAGITPPEKWNDEPRPKFPGQSLASTFDDPATHEHEPLFFKHQGNRALRRGDWKIVASGDSSPWELYNLAKDRSEQNNLADSNQDMVKELAAIWTARDLEYARQGATGEPLSRPNNAKGKKGQ